MENIEEENEEQKTNVKEKVSKIRFFILICIIIGVLLLIYYIEKLFLYLLSFIIFYYPLSILLLICLHLLGLRYLVYQILFIGQISFIDRQNKYFYGINQALFFEKTLNIMFKSLLSLSDKSIIKTYSKLIRIDIDIETCIENINYYIEIFSLMHDKYNGLSPNQHLFYDYLITLKREIDKLNILEKLSTEIQKKTEEESLETIVTIPPEIQYIFENNFFQIYDLIREINIILDKFMNVDLPWYSIKAYENYFTNDLLGSLKQSQVELAKLYNFEERLLKTKDNETIDYIIIKSINTPINKKNNLIIICSPNGANYQSFSKNLKLNIYLEKGIDIICWNYRGYGYSTGKVSIDNIKSDILELYNEIISWNKYGKIGVHGISVGGIPSCYLAFKKPEICLLISDRNFGQIDYIIKDYCFGNFLFYLFKFICFPKTRTIENFIDANSYKIILNDPKDNIVRETGSLKTLVSDYLIKNYLSINIEIKNDVSLQLNNNNINTNEKQKFIHYDNALDLLFNNNDNDIKGFKECLIDISERLNHKDFKRQNSFFENLKNKLFSKENQSEYFNLLDSPLKINAIEFLKSKMKNCLDKFISAGDSLESLLEIPDKRRKDLFITNFFNNFLIFGIEHTYQNISFFSTKGLEYIVKEIIVDLQNIINSQEINAIKEYKIVKSITKFQYYLKKLLESLKLIKVNVDEKKYPNEIEFLPEELPLENTNLENESNKLMFSENHINDYEKNLKLLKRGNLVSLTCGHNGNLNANEILAFRNQLEKSGIFELIDLK